MLLATLTTEMLLLPETLRVFKLVSVRILMDDSLLFPRSICSNLVQFKRFIEVNLLSCIVKTFIFGLLDKSREDNWLLYAWIVCSWGLFVTSSDVS